MILLYLTADLAAIAPAAKIARNRCHHGNGRFAHITRLRIHVIHMAKIHRRWFLLLCTTAILKRWTARPRQTRHVSGHATGCHAWLLARATSEYLDNTAQCQQDIHPGYKIYTPGYIIHAKHRQLLTVRYGCMLCNMHIYNECAGTT